MLPSIKELVVGFGDGDGDSDDVADTLKEMHGHMLTGDYKKAADAMRAAHHIISTERAEDTAGGDGNGLYD